MIERHKIRRKLDMNTVKNKMRRIMKKMISMVITLAMLVQYLPVNWLQDVFAAGTKPVSVSFGALNNRVL